MESFVKLTPSASRRNPVILAADIVRGALTTISAVRAGRARRGAGRIRPPGHVMAVVQPLFSRTSPKVSRKGAGEAQARRTRCVKRG